jgi:hypothetical protein
MDGFLSICDSKTPHWIESIQLPELKHNNFCVSSAPTLFCWSFQITQKKFLAGLKGISSQSLNTTKLLSSSFVGLCLFHHSNDVIDWRDCLESQFVETFDSE